MKWRVIRRGKDVHPLMRYWCEELGWTWKDMADTFTDEAKERFILPKDGEWEEIDE